MHNCRVKLRLSYALAAGNPGMECGWNYLEKRLGSYPKRYPHAFVLFIHRVLNEVENYHNFCG